MIKEFYLSFVDCRRVIFYNFISKL